MSVYMIESRYWIPTEAAGVITDMVKDAMCAGCPISVGGDPPTRDIYMTFYTNDIEITDAISYFDLTILGAGAGMVTQLNAEAAPTYCDGNIEGPTLGLGGAWELIFDQQIFTLAIADNTFFGSIVYAFDAGELLLGISRFDVPVTMAVGDILKHSGRLPLLPQVPLLDV